MDKGRWNTIKKSELDKINLYKHNKYYKSYEILGAHLVNNGVRFCVWAPNAQNVSVVGKFNEWDGTRNPMINNCYSGVWECLIEGLKGGELYKYYIVTKKGEIKFKSDPYGFYSELRPNTASIVYSLNEYKWSDDKWLINRNKNDIFQQPINIYEVHLASWKRKENGELYNYRELADKLVNYVVEMGYTHIELLPIMEHPFDGSWGYQITGYYSVTSRFGTPDDFMYFINKCHENNIGIILDWVPGHFCKDAHGLVEFDGSNLYGKTNHLHWGTMNFDFEKGEIRNFLISNALFWFDKFHIDGLRVDGVSSMLYLDYGYNDKTKAPKNKYGGNKNINAIKFMQKLNEVIFENYPFALMIAEESSAWPLVTRPTYVDGLGYNYKWDMGWMNDTLEYMQKEPLTRKNYHNLITFSMCYAFSENFILSLSHDEVVHGKKSLLSKMPGEYNEKFANYRLLISYMMFHPGKKLIFMGGEIAQFIEWRYYSELDWLLLKYEMHRKFKYFIKTINNLYKKEEALWQIDHNWMGFEWIDAENSSQSIYIFIRKSLNKDNLLIIVLNFTPKSYANYKIGVPKEGIYKIIFNSDLTDFGGTGFKLEETIKAKTLNWHNQPYCIETKIPPLASLVIKLQINSNTIIDLANNNSTKIKEV